MTAAVAVPGRPVGGPIVTGYREVPLPLDVTVTPANLAAVRAAYAQRRANGALPGYYRRHAAVMMGQIDVGGSMTVYGCLGHFPAGPAGVERLFIAALTDLLGAP